MHKLEDWFAELRRVLKHRSLLVDQGEDPVFFLVYPPAISLQIYRALPELEGMLKFDGWQPRAYDLGNAVHTFLSGHRDYPQYLAAQRQQTIEDHEVHKDLAGLLRDSHQRSIVTDWVRAEIDAAAQASNGLLLITGLELLHPYLQIGAIELQLQGKIRCPVVVLYPGFRTSAFGLKYLGFYPSDGNYRSRHVGGSLR